MDLSLVFLFSPLLLVLEEDEGRRVCPPKLILVYSSFEPHRCSNEIALLFENNSLALGCDSGECQRRICWEFVSTVPV